MNQMVAGSIPGQGTCLGCKLSPQVGWGAYGRQPIDASFSLSKINQSIKKFKGFECLQTYLYVQKIVYPDTFISHCTWSISHVISRPLKH